MCAYRMTRSYVARYYNYVVKYMQPGVRCGFDSQLTIYVMVPLILQFPINLKKECNDLLTLYRNIESLPWGLSES